MTRNSPLFWWLALLSMLIVTTPLLADDNSAPPPTIHEGDVWIDRLSSGEQEVKVLSMTPDRIKYTMWGAQEEGDSRLNTLVYGSPIGGGREPVVYSKPLVIFPFPLEPGKTWHDEVAWEVREPPVTGRNEVSGKLGDWEQVDVPAGQFREIKGEVTIRSIGRGESRSLTTITYWYAPKVNRFVKYHSEDETNGLRSIGGVIDAELVSYRPAKEN